MMIEMSGRVKETKNSKGIWLNTIDIKLRNKRTLTIDRDTTYYTINDDGTYTMQWFDPYVWDADDGIADYDIDRYDWSDAELINMDIEDDADAEYNITIDDWSVCR